MPGLNELDIGFPTNVCGLHSQAWSTCALTAHVAADEISSQSMMVFCGMHACQPIACGLQADSNRAWYEGEAGRRQAAQAAAESQRQAEQAQRKVLYQDLQSAAVLRQKEAQLLEHRYVSCYMLPSASAALNVSP